MLIELKITDFATIEDLTLSFNPSFNVLTGETGAGKSIILDAVTMLLGGRADTDFIRGGSERAYIEGVFTPSHKLQELLNPILEREGLEGDTADLLVLSRELRITGRNICRVNGRTVNLSQLVEIAHPLVDIHGQNEHLSILQVRQHQRLLDRYGELDSQRETLATKVRQLHQVRHELTNLLKNEQYLARRLDQLSFQVNEIETANLQLDEEKELNLERSRLANAEQLGQLTAKAYKLLVGGETEEPSVSDLFGQVSRLFAQLTKLDYSITEKMEAVDGLTYQIEEVATFLRDYNENIDFTPNRLQEVEERGHLIFNLKRKYGNSIEEILEFAQKAKAELESISHSEERMGELQQTEEKLRHEIGRLGVALSKARWQAGQDLGQRIVTHLADLGMGRTQFMVDIEWKDDPMGVYVTQPLLAIQSEDALPYENGTDTDKKSVAFDERGIDRIEFLISPNPGEPLKPLAKIASGGETSRLMLALKTVLASADDTPTLIFDEIDQGIGGRVGSVVGRKLWQLSDQGNHQVLCVTHLPQIACYADAHYHVTKQIIGERTHTLIRILRNNEQIEELAEMLGTLSDNSRASAREILSEAAAVKAQ